MVALDAYVDSRNLIDSSLPNQNRLVVSDSARNELGKKNHDIAQEVKSLKREVEAINFMLKQIMAQLEPGIPSALNDSLSLSQLDLGEIKFVEENIKKASDQQYSEQIAMVEDEFFKQPIDPSWSEDKTQILKVALNSLPDEKFEGVEVKATDCRSSMCRIEIEYTDELAQNMIEMQLPMLVGEDFSRLSVMYENQDGIIKGIYFLKNGDA